MLKLYQFWTNNGDWGGCQNEYAIAETEDEVWKKCPNAAGRVEEGYDFFIKELTPYDILRHFVWNEAEKYNITFTIEEKK